MTELVEKLKAALVIRWIDGASGNVFGAVGKTQLFHIKDRKIDEQLDKYELEVKFLDQRWTSNDVDKLKSVAKDALHNLLTDITSDAAS